MNKSIRNFALTAVVLFSSVTPMFANMTSGVPHPTLVSVSLSLNDYAGIAFSVFGL